MAERSKAPDSRFTFPADSRGMRILVLVWGRGFESHFWQNNILQNYKYCLILLLQDTSKIQQKNDACVLQIHE